MESVKDRLDKKAYELLDLPELVFFYGSIKFARPDTIDEMQKFFRYNGVTGELEEGWKESNIVIGHDRTAGLGPDAFILDTSDSKLPVYWLMTDGGDWENPDLVCEDLETFHNIIIMLSEQGSFNGHFLTEEDIENILNKIRKIENKEDISPYWNNLLYAASEELS